MTLVPVRRVKGHNDSSSLPCVIMRTYNGGTPYVFQSFNFPQRDSWGALEGYNLPGFRAAVRRGELIPMTYFYHMELWGTSSGDSDCYCNNGSIHYHDYCAAGSWNRFEHWRVTSQQLIENAPDWSSDLVQEAAAKVYANGHDTLTFLAELVDVREMFVKTAKKLIKMDWPRNWRTLSSDWLSARYGWRTLIYDLQDLNKALQGMQEKRTRYSERAVRKESHSAVQTFTSTEGGNTFAHNIVSTYTILVRGSIVADIVVPKFQFNPLQTGWELIPFSFVIDWFVSVGKTIAALSFLALQTNYTAAGGFRVEIDRTYEVHLQSFGDQYWTGYCTQSGSAGGYFERRIPCPVPLLPHFALKLNNLKVLDLIALLLQRLRR